MKYIIAAGVLCLALLGLTELLHMLKLLLIKPEKRAIVYSLIILHGDTPERQLLPAIEQRLWLGGDYCDHIIAVDISSVDDGECRSLAEKYGVIYCTGDSLNNTLRACLVKP